MPTFYTPIATDQIDRDADPMEKLYVNLHVHGMHLRMLVTNMRLEEGITHVPGVPPTPIKVYLEGVAVRIVSDTAAPITGGASWCGISVPEVKGE